jgi:hypothetical protein
MAKGTQESVEQAKQLYDEVKGIYAEFATQAAEAAKENRQLEEQIREARMSADDKSVEEQAKEINELEKERVNVQITQAEATEKLKEAQAKYQEAIKSSYNIEEKSLKDNLEKAQKMKEKWSDASENIKKSMRGVVEQINHINEIQIEDKRAEISMEYDDVEDALRKVDKLTNRLKALNGATVSYSVQGTESTVQQNKEGGFISKAKQFATGGFLPGYGGGDKIKSLLESGEFVMRKEAVKQYGRSFFEELNNMKVKSNSVSGSMPSSSSSSKSSSMDMANFGTLNLQIGESSYPVMAHMDVANEIKRSLSKEQLRRRNG